MSHRIFTIDPDTLTGDTTWPTKQMDMAAALAIIQRHQAETGGPLRLIEDWRASDDGTFWVQLPEWLIELNKVFYDRYDDEAEKSLQRVMQELLSVDIVH